MIIKFKFFSIKNYTFIFIYKKFLQKFKSKSHFKVFNYGLGAKNELKDIFYPFYGKVCLHYFGSSNKKYIKDIEAQPLDHEVKKVSNLIPFGSLANIDEYRGTIIYMLSDASSYMNGAVLSVFGGLTSW